MAGGPGFRLQVRVRAGEPARVLSFSQHLSAGPWVRHRAAQNVAGRPVLLIGVDGFDSAAIQKVLEEYGLGGLRNWLSVDSEEQQALGNLTDLSSDPAAPIEASSSTVPYKGKLLLEWGMAPTRFPIRLPSTAQMWVIGAYVIRATLNTDPLGRTPYSVSSWEKLPGSFWGSGRRS